MSHMHVHERLKAYVCVLYDSHCAPLLLPWLGEVEGTSLAMYQAKASPVPAPEPMLRVSAVLRRYEPTYDADVPLTRTRVAAVGACCGCLPVPPNAFLTRDFAAGALSGSRVRNAFGGTGRRTSIAYSIGIANIRNIRMRTY